MNEDLEAKYSINMEIKFKPLELIDIPKLVEESKRKWQNYSLCQVNDSVVRLGVLEGEFHWHKHDDGDEFFYVIDGKLFIDLENQTVELNPMEGFVIPRRILHQTRAPTRTIIMMVENITVKPTGD